MVTFRTRYAHLDHYEWRGIQFSGDRDIFCAGSPPTVTEVDPAEWEFYMGVGCPLTESAAVEVLEDAYCRSEPSLLRELEARRD